jgi:hypothetical protein
MLSRATEAVAAKLRDSKTTFVLETLSNSVSGAPQPVIIRNKQLDEAKSLLFSHFCSQDKNQKSYSAEVISY